LENGQGVTLGQYHEWESFDASTTKAAKLHVEYKM